MTHPKHHVPKTYRVEAHGMVTPESVRRLSTGILLEDGMTSSAKVTLTGYDSVRRVSTLEMTLTEGRKRQIRRMLQAIGHRVAKLTRVKIGSITIGRLRPGQWRYLSPGEVATLLRTAS